MLTGFAWDGSMTESIYRGYVSTTKKRCTMPFKEGRLLTLEQAQRLTEYAGVLADGVLLVDFDNADMAQAALRAIDGTGLRCMVYRTHRGIHVLLKATPEYTSCGTAVMLACGMTADIKLGSKNSYEVLRMNGSDRELIRNTGLDDAPAWLYPIRADKPLYGLGEGDGRNDRLFTHILTLTRAGLDKDTVRDVLTIVNTYVFKEPLPKHELETVMRDDAFTDALKPAFFSGRTFLHADFADWLITQYHIVRIDGQLHIYSDGVYEDGYKPIEEAMVTEIKSLTAQKRTEVMKYLELTAPRIQRSDARYIAFDDCAYDAITGEFQPHTPEIAITNRIPHNAPIDTVPGLTDDVLDRLACHDEQTRLLLEEIAGYCLYRRNELRKAFVLLGDKANGKSTYLDMVKSLLGDRNVCALDLKEIGDRFKTAELYGKLANVGDDIGDDFIKDLAIFKKAVSGDRMNAERKGKDPFDFAPYAKLLFSANALPRVKDRTGAVLDRLIIVPFKANFSKGSENYDPYIKYRLREPANIQRFAYLALQGLKRVLAAEAFTIPSASEQAMTEYEQVNDTVTAFLDDYDPNGKTTRAVYNDYVSFCLSDGVQAVSNIEFTRQIKRKTGLSVVRRSVSGDAVKIYQR